MNEEKENQKDVSKEGSERKLSSEGVVQKIEEFVEKMLGHEYFELSTDIREIPEGWKAKAKVEHVYKDKTLNKVFTIKNGEIVRVE